MSAICLIDTSVFVEILDVPRKACDHEQVLLELQTKIENSEGLFLPMATILETGNHIAQNGDGGQKRACALKFVSLVQEALEGKSPFKPISFLEKDQLRQWLSEFPDSAMRGNSLGDLSIIHDFNRFCGQNPRREIYIWSKDNHLSSFHHQARY
jgi:predicted nucleic acid-binding protein